MSDAAPPRPSLSAARFETPAGGGAFELPKVSIGVFLVDQPTHRIAVNGDKRADRPLAANQGWLMPSGASGLCEYDAEHAFVLVQLDDGLLRDVGFDARRGFAPQIGALDPLLLQMALSAAAPPAGAPTLYVETMRQALAAHLAQLLQPAPVAEIAIEDARLRRAVSYIHDHLASEVSLDALAAEAAMSPFHFSRAFKAAIGVSPLQYVIQERLERAKLLLRTTQLPVAEVAHRVGYEDVSRFGRRFKRRFSATPGSVRS